MRWEREYLDRAEAALAKSYGEASYARAELYMVRSFVQIAIENIRDGNVADASRYLARALHPTEEDRKIIAYVRGCS